MQRRQQHGDEINPEDIFNMFFGMPVCLPIRVVPHCQVAVSIALR